MSFLRAVAAAFATFVLCGGSALAESGRGYSDIVWRARPVPIALESESRTAPLGSFLFVQDFAAASEAVLAQPLTSDTPSPIWSRPPPHITDVALVEVGNAGSRAPWPTNSPAGDVALFCEPGTVQERTRVCLEDSNRDGVFDFRYWAGAASAPVYTPMLPGLSRQDMNSNGAPTISSPYSVQTSSTRLLAAGLVITRSSLGAYRLQFAVSQNGTPDIVPSIDAPARSRASPNVQSPLNADAVYFRGDDMPIVLEMAGARIEIQGVVEGIVTYRILSLFDSESSFGIGYMGALPITP